MLHILLASSFTSSSGYTSLSMQSEALVCSVCLQEIHTCKCNPDQVAFVDTPGSSGLSQADVRPGSSLSQAKQADVV